jgi:hypothetical protein
MAEHFAHGAQVCAVVEKVCGKGVTQHVRTLALGFGDGAQSGADDSPC